MILKTFNVFIFSAFLLFNFVSESAFADDSLSDEKILALGINPSGIKTQLAAFYGVTSHFNDYIGLLKRKVVLTNEALYVLNDDERGIEIKLPISNIRSAEIKHRSTLFGNTATIEVDTETAFLMFTFQPGKAAIGDKLYSELLNTGVRESVSTMVKDNSKEGLHKVRTLVPLKELGAL